MSDPFTSRAVGASPLTDEALLCVTITGAPALSEFRRDRILRRLQQRQPATSAVAAQYVYYLECDGAPDEPALAALSTILNDGAEYEGFTTGLRFDVAPRVGTISPWSSKATDIIQRCGVRGVRRVERAVRYAIVGIDAAMSPDVEPLLHDRMTEQCYAAGDAGEHLFRHLQPKPLRHVELGAAPLDALGAANRELGLALSDDELEYLAEHYAAMGRPPTDAELMMFAQANSEHCRHKIFNAEWTVDAAPQPLSLFAMIRNTTNAAPAGVISAYSDNAAVLAGPRAPRLYADNDRVYRYHDETVDVLIKVETHNHPTAISPFPGAATGAGGEIRDEGATGLGASPKAGVTGFSVSDLNVPDWPRPWETDIGRPGRIVSSLEVMLEGPIGGAAFNNEFGRPNLGGYFRSYQAPAAGAGEYWGYHKPIMIAGGLGNVRRMHALKKDVHADSLLIVLGGPAMLIGLGGGAASSMASGSSDEALDFASVQRGNPEMQRRAQEVINRCWALGLGNPIELIHDVGAGGLSNAVPEAVDHSSLGGRFELREIPNDEPGMSPMEIWCNESQERYVLIVNRERLADFSAICERERCPFAVLGSLADDGRLRVDDAAGDAVPVDLPMQMLLGKPPKMQREAVRVQPQPQAFDVGQIDIADAVGRVLGLPSVADKSFLIHIADRTVGGLTARDQLVGPWQVPVADVAVTLATHHSFRGEAVAMGERTPVACDDAPAAARLAVAEAITNIIAADVQAIGDIKLSANWMAAAGHAGQDAALFDAVAAVGLELCPALGISIPVGKDSLSMKTTWQDVDGRDRAVLAPVSLIVTAFAPVRDARRTLTPQLADVAGSRLLLIDLAASADALGRSALAQVFNAQGGAPADLAGAGELAAFVDVLIGLKDNEALLAYHDRSDGGVLACVAEMLFAARLGVDLQVPDACDNALRWLFAEGPGAVVQVAPDRIAEVTEAFTDAGLGARLQDIGGLNARGSLTISQRDSMLFEDSRANLQLGWSETSFRLQALRDNPTTAAEAYERIADESDPGLNSALGFDPAKDVAAPMIASGVRPRVAVLREQGVNSQQEMAAALLAAGFDAIDVHMSDLESGLIDLKDYKTLVACGGFSYGDVLGAGGGWAKSILLVERLRDQFAAFFDRSDTLSLGVCNGCQMFSQLTPIIPGSDGWPMFVANRSAQFEARLSMVEVANTSSPWFDGMQGSRLPIVVSHGEGRAQFRDPEDMARCTDRGMAALHYVENSGAPAERYPANPNGSEAALAALTSADGRVAISMPHPERVARSVQFSWRPDGWGEDGPWLRLFRNARVALG